jgi:hypothetical protein
MISVSDEEIEMVGVNLPNWLATYVAHDVHTSSCQSFCFIKWSVPAIGLEMKLYEALAMALCIVVFLLPLTIVMSVFVTVTYNHEHVHSHDTLHVIDKFPRRFDKTFGNEPESFE